MCLLRRVYIVKRNNENSSVFSYFILDCDTRGRTDATEDLKIYLKLELVVFD